MSTHKLKALKNVKPNAWIASDLPWDEEEQTDVQQKYEKLTIENAPESLKEMVNEITVCIRCKGDTRDPIEFGLEHHCCGNFDRLGNCCGQPTVEQVAIACTECKGTGSSFKKPE